MMYFCLRRSPVQAFKIESNDLYVHLYVCAMYVGVYVRMCVCVYVCMYVFIYVCMYVRTYVCMYVYMYVRTCV